MNAAMGLSMTLAALRARDGAIAGGKGAPGTRASGSSGRLRTSLALSSGPMRPLSSAWTRSSGCCSRLPAGSCRGSSAWSHGAVVAREYGIPAVVGVAGATELIATGQRLTVDGSGGSITLEDGG